MKTYILKLFPAIGQPYFRQFWLSQTVALLGLWMQITAQQWLAYSLTGSAVLLGLLGVAQFGPVMLFSLPAGVYIDRIPKRTLLRYTQSAYLIQSFILAFLVFTDMINYYNLLFLAFIYGCIQTVDMPARQSFIPELVPKELLRSAISMNSANINVARMIGPAFAAILMTTYGPGLLFLLNGLSMFPVLYVYWNLPLEGRPDTNQICRNLFRDVYDGLCYTRKKLPLYASILSLLCISMLIINYNVISPVYADRVLHEGVTGFGMITTSIGFGSFIAAIWSATQTQATPGPKTLFGSGILASLTLLFLGMNTHYQIALFLFACFGFFNLIFVIAANTIIQLHTDLAHRGRMLSLYSLVFLGATPPGNMLTGTMIQYFDIRMGISLCAIAALLLILPLVIHVQRKLQHYPNAFSIK